MERNRPSEQIILRTWMREYDQHEGTVAAMREVARVCGVSYGRVQQVIQRSTFQERESIRPTC